MRAYVCHLPPTALAFLAAICCITPRKDPLVFSCVFSFPINTHYNKTMVESRGGRLPYSGRSFRFSRATFANVERPPVILEWSSTILRVGHAEQACPQHIIPSNHDNNSTNMYDEEDWYFVIAPLLAKIWNRLCLDPSSRRVVVVAPSLYVSSTWEASMKQALWDLSVPAVTITTCLETIPYSMGWKRGLVMHVGIEEVQCLILANGASLYDTFQGMKAHV